MGRLFAYMGNDPDRVRCALHSARRLLVIKPERGVNYDSWGIGFYQGEVLLQRRPKPLVEPVDFFEVASDLRTDCIVGHVRTGTVGQPKNENTHPFRFRSWLFAHHGTLPAWDQIQERLLEQVPDFLRRNIRGQTDSEALFHLILAELHEENQLDDGNLTPGPLRAAMQRALARLRDLVGPDQLAGAELALAMTNGRILVATRHGRPVHAMSLKSVTDCPVCRETAEQARPGRQVNHEHLRATVIVADAPAQNGNLGPWREVPDKTFVSVSQALELSETPIQL